MNMRAQRRVLPGFGLTMGITVLYLSLIVLIPLATLPARTMTMSWAAFRETNARNGPRDFAGNEGLATARRFMIEQNPVARVHAVGLTIVHGDPV